MLQHIQNTRSPFDQEIDQQVYDLYGLTPEEIAIVEENGVSVQILTEFPFPLRSSVGPSSGHHPNHISKSAIAALTLP